ncbi:hypothetical protein [Streptomyces bacillaris]|uniref:hypothetical protein n=1 Tax=Streptomyces bacillaris TaxID=68179 RepID=UPI0038053632
MTKELLGHAQIGVTADVEGEDPDDPPATAIIRRRCRAATRAHDRALPRMSTDQPEFADQRKCR